MFQVVSPKDNPMRVRIETLEEWNFPQKRKMIEHLEGFHDEITSRVKKNVSYSPKEGRYSITKYYLHTGVLATVASIARVSRKASGVSLCGTDVYGASFPLVAAGANKVTLYEYDNNLKMRARAKSLDAMQKLKNFFEREVEISIPKAQDIFEASHERAPYNLYILDASRNSMAKLCQKERELVERTSLQRYACTILAGGNQSRLTKEKMQESILEAVSLFPGELIPRTLTISTYPSNGVLDTKEKKFFPGRGRPMTIFSFAKKITP